MIRKCFVVVMVLALPVVATCGREAPLFPDTDPAEVEYRVGPRRILMPEGANDLNYFPDGPLSILSTRPLRFLMVCGNETLLFAGRDFRDAVPQSRVLTPGGTGPDAHYAGIYAALPEEGRNRLLGFYHAEDHEGMGKIGSNGINGFNATVCLAALDQRTGDVERFGPILTADLPKRKVEGSDAPLLICQGVGEPHVIADSSRKYLLCYYTEWSNRKRRNVTLCLAHCPLENGGRPGAWMKYHERGFEVKGLGGHDTPILSCSRGDVFQAQVSFVPRWDRYVMIFGCLVGKEYVTGKAKRSGFYVATSQDSIRWTEPQRVMTELTVFKNGHGTIQHPTLVVSQVTKDRLQGLILYAYTPRWPIPHHLASNPITVRLKGR